MPKTLKPVTYANRNRSAETGAGLVEYALLLLMVALVTFPAVTSFGAGLDAMFRNLAGGGSFTTMGEEETKKVWGPRM